jgi:hypothetical protein
MTSIIRSTFTSYSPFPKLTLTKINSSLTKVIFLKSNPSDLANALRKETPYIIYLHYNQRIKLPDEAM